MGFAGGDLSFLTKGAPTLLRQLRNNRNKVEHEPDAGVDLNDIRYLYQAHLGIGRRGVIPELVRLLNENNRA